jgi:hypothetical protein
LHSYDNESEEERKKLAWYIRGFLSLKKLSMKLANFSMWLVAVRLCFSPVESELRGDKTSKAADMSSSYA